VGADRVEIGFTPKKQFSGNAFDNSTKCRTGLQDQRAANEEKIALVALNERGNGRPVLRSCIVTAKASTSASHLGRSRAGSPELRPGIRPPADVADHERSCSWEWTASEASQCSRGVSRQRQKISLASACPFMRKLHSLPIALLPANEAISESQSPAVVGLRCAKPQHSNPCGVSVCILWS
jgi:hypothetical protein